MKAECFAFLNLNKLSGGAAEILIRDLDVPNNNEKHLLENHQVIYRGLHQLEHDSKIYYQSWTINKNKAKEFANDVYHDHSNNIVVHARVSKLEIIYYNSNDSEQEVIVKKGVITGAEKI